MKNRNSAFTLIEFIILVAITCLLVVVTLPTYQKNTTQARLATVIDAMELLNHQLLHSFYSNGVSPQSLAGVSGAGNGGYAIYEVDDVIKTLHYVNGSRWIHKGAMIQVSIPFSIGKGIPGFIESTNGSDGAYNSIAMAFYDNGGTIMTLCGRWDSTSTLYIPIEFLPNGCNNDNFKDIVVSKDHQ